MEQGHGVTYIDVKLFHGISNHIEIRYHFIRQYWARWNKYQAYYKKGASADILTKWMVAIKFDKMRALLYIKDLQNKV